MLRCDWPIMLSPLGKHYRDALVRMLELICDIRHRYGTLLRTPPTDDSRFWPSAGSRQISAKQISSAHESMEGCLSRCCDHLCQVGVEVPGLCFCDAVLTGRCSA